MSDEVQTIRVEIRAAAAQFRAEMDSALKKLAGPGGLKDAIKDVPNDIKVDVLIETSIAQAKLVLLQDEAKKAKRVIEDPASMDVDIAKAMIKLETLKAKAEQVERDLTRESTTSRLERGISDALNTIGGGGSGGGAGTFIGGTGPIPGVTGAALAAGSPAILAGLGGLTGIAGSAGAGLLGAGAVGVGGAGILATGLGAIIPVAKQAVEGIQNVTAAQDALTKAEADYGAGSKQARQAQVNLNAVVKEAGPGVLQLTHSLEDLEDRWNRLSAPARSDFFKILNEGLGVAKQLLPTIAQIAQSSLGAIDQGLQPIFRGLASPEFKADLLFLGHAFALLAPSLLEGFASIFQALMNVAIAAAPYVIQLAHGFAELTAGWVSSTSHGSELSQVVGGLFSQFKSWWELAKALGGVLVSVFSAGASSGQGLVNTLTGILREWDRWMNTGSGQAQMRAFFADCAALVRTFFAALAPLVAALFQLIASLMPTFTRAIQVLSPLVTVLAGGIKLLASVFGDGRIAGNLLAEALIAVGVAFAYIKIAAFLAPIAEAITEVGGLSVALRGLWAILLENPLGLLLGGLTLIAGALGAFSMGEGHAKTSTEDLTKAIDAQHEALSRLKDIATETEQVDLAKQEAATNLAVAERQLETDRKSHHPDRLQIAQDEEQVSQARLDLKRATKEAEEQGTKNAKTEREVGEQVKKTQQTYHDRGTTIESNIHSIKDEIAAQEHDGAAMKNSATYTAALTEKKERLAAEERKLTTNQKNESKSLDEAAAAAEGSIPAFDKLHDKIVSLWTDGAGATKKGLAEINKLTLDELKILAPASIKEAGSIGANLKKGLAFAGGGWIGQEGDRGRDEVPIVVGRGEAILHAGHQQIVNEALAYSGMPGGLSQVFSQTGGLHYNFAGGGYAGGGFVSTAYGPPWGGIQGGGTTATGIDLHNAPAKYIVAVDPSVIPLHSQMKIWPNPFNYRGDFSAEDTGGAIKGNRIDFYDWLGRASQNAWGRRDVSITIDGKGGAIQGAANGGAGSPSSIAAVKAKGVSGAIGEVAQGALDTARGAANRILRGLTPAAGAGVGGAVTAAGGAPTGGSFDPSQVGSFDGLTVARWIIPELAYARAHGWGGRITSGVRLGFDPHAPSGSMHALDVYPGGAVDFGGMVDPAGLANRAAFIRATTGYTGKKLLTPVGFRDDGHMSGTGHAAGGYAGGKPLSRFFAGAGFARTASRKGQTPPKPRSHTPSRPPKPKAPHKISTSTWASMPKDVLAATKRTQHLAGEATAEDTIYQHLLDSQRLVPTQPLVTLTDADVAALDPQGTLGYQQGDQIVNPQGMTVGRWFGPSGITGGTYVAGIDTRQAQLGELLGAVGNETGFVESEQTLDTEVAAREKKAVEQKRERRERIRAFLTKSVAHAQNIKRQLQQITTGDLKKNLAAALSRQAISGRRSELQGHQQSLTTELAAERHHQAQLIPIEKDPSYTQSLEQQLAGVKGAIAAEGQLSSGSSAAGAVSKAREAILKDSLKRQLSSLSEENRRLGGQAYTIGTGGLWGTVNKQISALVADEPGWATDHANAATTLYGLGKTKAELLAEQAALPGTIPIQIRSPGAAGGLGSEQLLALIQQQLQTTQQALALSQAQYSVFRGFAPLAQGRMVGTFATGIDRVPRTGPAIVHQGEVILPDPDGPYGNRAAAQARGGGDSGPVEVILMLDDRNLLKVVDARMNQKSLRVVSDHGGQRARLIAGVTNR